MDDDLGFGYTHRRKRTHSHMDLDGPVSPWDSFAGRSSSPSHSHPQVSGLHLPRIGAMPSAPPRRYPGDGMDYRRPVSLQRSDDQSAIIDLTTDDAGPSASDSSNNGRAAARVQRPPRFAREIIDLVDEEIHPTAVTQSESPEIQFISSRRLASPRRQDVRRDTQSNSDQDDVEFVGANPLPADRRRGHRLENMMVGVIEGMMLDERQNHFAHLRARIERAVNNGPMPIVPPRAGRAARRTGQIHVGFIPPTMDFEMVGFDLGLGAGPVGPPPTYDKPEAAPEGFTRSPAEEDALVCPNCKEELCLGDSDLKKQVWIVKACGHVYCGECAANRSTKKSAKGKERAATQRTQPFKICVVDGCEKKTSPPKSMIQVFL